MKCIKNVLTGKVIRVHNTIAQIKTTESPKIWKYVPKGEWKYYERKKELEQEEKKDG